MVVCKYYQQGNCRYGQYCQFEHINTFGANNNKVESYNDDEYTAVAVAKEVLSAERGGQWLLSCFAPLKHRPCIPGMEDLSPEEVRWKMYQAQKNGMVEQAKLHFQQLCQDMKAKRDALKNPTRETVAMLKELQGNARKGLPSNTPSTNVFGNKSFVSQNNPFGGGFASQNTTSIFGRKNNTSNPAFGGTPSFGTSLGCFGSVTSSSSVFGGTTNTAGVTTFSSGQNAQSFGTTGSIFGAGTQQSVFGQPSVFGASGQVNNVFARPQTSQSTTSAFNTGAASSSSIFSSGSAPQSNASPFGGAKTTTANPFGATSTLQTANPLFGTTPSTGSFSSGIFSQPKTVPAFGGAPVFGSGANFGNAPAPLFSEQPTFGGSSNIFGGPSTTTPTFSSAAQSGNAFGAPTSTPAVNLFGSAQNPPPAISTPNASPFSTTTPTINSPFGTGTPTTSSPFGAATPTTSSPFGVATSTTSSPFATATSHFEPTSSTAAGPFSRPTFGMTTGTTGDTFGTTVTSSTAPFSTANTGIPFGTPSNAAPLFTTSTFGDLKSSPFATTNTTVTTTNTNPFAPRTQQTTLPFGNFVQNDPANTVTVSTASPFGATMTTAVIDDSVYSIEGQLTDDEKQMYLAEKFIFGKIPLKPPTKDIR
ncbi:nuclear pore complex protein DDB_G0274915-like [Hylaeus volcanicus]|uniref:nuclear pore complex protein DDB_G0274915-like n=1 Tax=Hylaeus volcanicus TaxID=313075 RepID=UPI0023B7B1A5|nr:nuclear pore complex protein DDB_G0274915-like [Hylaeus volcanicus]